MIGHVVVGLSVAKEPSRHFRGLQLPPNGGRDQLKDAPRRRDERWPCGSVPTRQGGSSPGCLCPRAAGGIEGCMLQEDS